LGATAQLADPGRHLGGGVRRVWFSLYLLITTLFVLVADRWDSSLTFFAGMVLLVVAQIVPLQIALQGFSNSAVAR
jgi:hypothetical protein